MIVRFLNPVKAATAALALLSLPVGVVAGQVNVSNSPALSDKAKLELAVDPVTRQRTHIVPYADGAEGGRDIFVSVSTDEGATWLSPTNLSQTAGLTNVLGAPGDSTKPQLSVNGEMVLIAWTDSYCPGGAQGSHDNDLDGVRTAYFCVYVSRSSDSGATWSAREQLTDGSRDAANIMMSASTSGFGLVWQEDPEGLQPGEGEGPGDGGSGAHASPGTDIHYTAIQMSAFAAGTAFPAPVEFSDNVATESGSPSASRPQIKLVGSTALIAYEETKSSGGKHIIWHAVPFTSGAGGNSGTAMSSEAENSRRVRIISQGALAAGPADTRVILLWRQGSGRMGAPADIIMRRGVGGYAASNFQPAVNLSSANLGDSTSANPTENARAHRALLRGDRVAFVYVYTANDAQSLVQQEHYDTYIRMSYDGGVTWDATRNLSGIGDHTQTAMEPRLVGTSGTIPTGNPADVQNSSVFVVIWATAANTELAEPIDIWARRTTDVGATFEPPLALAWGASGQSEAQLRVRPDGNQLSAAYMDDVTGNRDVWFTSLLTAGFSPVTPSPAVAGVAYAQTFTVPGEAGPFTFFATGPLPAGVSLLPDGTLAGTPLVVGRFPFMLEAFDGTGSHTARELTLEVACPGIVIGPVSLPSCAAGRPYADTTFTQTGGIAPVTFGLSGTLPSGMTLVDGTLSGTPTQVGNFPIVIGAVDANACPGDRSYTLVVDCPPITVGPLAIPAATATVAYEQTFTQAGGVGASTFSLAGVLPAGFGLTGASLTGTTTSVGTFPFTVTATDANGCQGMGVYTLVVGCPTITVSPATIPGVTIGRQYTVRFGQAGGVGTATFVLSGTLPRGLTVSDGTLSGIPAESGTFPFTVTATDANGCTGTASLTLVVDLPPMSIDPTALPAAIAGAPYSQRFRMSGASGTVTFVVSGALPQGLALVGGVLSGTPAAAGRATFTITGTDAYDCRATRSYVLDVAPGPPTVAITAPTAAANHTATSSFVRLEGTAQDEAGIASVRWSSDRGVNGQAAGTVAWRADDVPVWAGANVITVTATDVHGLTATDIITVTVDSLGYYLAEGATGSFFDYDLVLANPTPVGAPFTLTFLRPDGSTTVVEDTLPPQSQRTIRVDDMPGVAATAVSAIVSSDAAVPLLVERSLFWVSPELISDASDPSPVVRAWRAGHGAAAVDGPRARWLFAEGAQGFFDTYVLLANPNAVPATASVIFMLEGGGTVVRAYDLPPTSRLTICAGAIPDLIGRSFGIDVSADEPIIAERATYLSTDHSWRGGHGTAGVNEASTSWWFAEGATGPFFDTYLLVANPNPQPATVTITRLFENQALALDSRIVGPQSRMTINLEAAEATTTEAVSTLLTSDQPVVAERAMYWPGASTAWAEAHDSFGATAPRLKWGLAEGRVGGPLGFETYVLMANPSEAPADVTLTFLRDAGTPVQRRYTIPPTSRFTLPVNDAVPELVDEHFGVVIEVTNGVPIVAERSMYWTAHGIPWIGGTSVGAVPLP